MTKELWFKTYKFDENPFKITPNPEKLVGLENEYKKALAAVDSGDIFQLTGCTGAGKTTLMKKLMTNLTNDYTPIYYDCSSQPASDFSMKKLMTKNSFFGLVRSEYSKKDRVVLFCDEIQKLDENKTEEIKSFYDAEKLHAVIFSSISEANIVDSMRSRITDNTHLAYPDKEILATMLKKRLEGGVNPFTDEAINEIIERSGKNPRITLINAEKVCKEFYKDKKEEKSISVELVKQVVKPEKDALLISHIKGKEKGIWDNESGEVATKEVKVPTGSDIEQLQKKFSPLQWSIISALSVSSKGLSYEELANATGKSKETLGKQLSRLGLVSDIELMKRKGINAPIVKKFHRDGKPHYDLVDEVRFLLARK